MEYEEFKAKMDELLVDYKEFILWLKDNIHSLKDLISHFAEVIPKVVLIWAATKAVAEQMHDLPSSIQRHYFALYLDDLFEFQNVILEGIDRYVFEVIFYFCEYFGDYLFPGKKSVEFKDMAQKILSTPTKKKVKFKVVAK